MLKTDVSSFVKPFDAGDMTLLSATIFSGTSRKDVRTMMNRIEKQAGNGNIYLIKENQDLLLCGFSSLDTAANQASAWIMPSVIPADSNRSLPAKALSFLLYEGFFLRKLHKINICIESRNSCIREILETSQFRQEGTLIDHFYKDGRYDDGILYAMLANDFHHHSIGLIPFLTGYLIIQTTNDAVFSISIIKEGEDIPDFIDENCEYKKQISENNKIIKPSGDKSSYLYETAYPYLVKASEQLFRYIKGILTNFDLAFEFAGATDFQKQVWAATIQIPYGQTRTYEEIACQLKPKDNTSDLRLLSRSVGTALGKNPIMIAIPCHRVIGKDGKLKGFSGGLEVKDFLLSHEMLFLK